MKKLNEVEICVKLNEVVWKKLRRLKKHYHKKYIDIVEDAWIEGCINYSFVVPTGPQKEISFFINSDFLLIIKIRFGEDAIRRILYAYAETQLDPEPWEV